jgi:hypothetical protein
MRKYIPKYIGLLCFVAFLFSCEKEIKYRGNEGKSLLVVNSINQTDSFVSLYLERSYFFLDKFPYDESKQIKNGAILKLIDLTSGETEIITTPKYDNFYEFPLKTINNHHYKLEISHSEFPTIESSMVMCGSVVLEEVDTSSIYEGTFVIRKKAILKWKDPVGTNFYIIQVNALKNGEPIDPDYNVPISISSSDVSLGQNNFFSGEFFEQSYASLMFSDQLFENKFKEFEIRFFPYFDMEDSTAVISYQYHLFNLCEDTYRYIASIEKQKNTDGFGEPVKVYNNIKNGYGIFSGKGRSTISK